MKAALALLALIACAALAVASAQNIILPAPTPVLDPVTGLPIVTEEPAIIGAPRAGLKKPIIFDPKPPASPNDPEEPIFGRPPRKLKRAAVSESITASAVEFEKGREVTGCPCKRQVPDRWRYDVKLRREWPKFNFTACGCALPPWKPEDALPPVVARLRREPQLFAMPLPNNGTHTLMLNGTITTGVYSLLSNGTMYQSVAPLTSANGVAPIYRKYSRSLHERIEARMRATAPLFNLTRALFRHHRHHRPSVQPEFYPTWAERRERRRARREAARKAATEAATKKF